MRKLEQTNNCYGQFLFITILALMAGVVGGWAQGWYKSGQESSEPLRQEKSVPFWMRTLPHEHAWASELGIQGAVRRVTFPEGYKVHVMQYIWTPAVHQRFDYTNLECTLPTYSEGMIKTGVRTFQPGVMQRSPANKIKVSLYGPNGEMMFWLDIKDSSVKHPYDFDSSPLELSEELLGKTIRVAEVKFGDTSKLPGDRVPTIEELEGMDLYAAVWVRLEKDSSTDSATKSNFNGMPTKTDWDD